MEKKEYLNEEWYQTAKEKITRISLIILIIAVLVGSSLIAIGIIKTNLSKKETEKINEERYNAAYKEYEEKVAAVEKRLNEIASEKELLNKQYDSKNQECDSLNKRDSDWFAKVNQCHREASAIGSQINDLKTEEFKLNNTEYTVYYDKEIAKSYTFLCVIGGIILFIGGYIAFEAYMITRRREITAFQAQQVMPLAQEGIEKMTPTIGNAAETITKGISKGIKDGIKDEENK